MVGITAMLMLLYGISAQPYRLATFLSKLAHKKIKYKLNVCHNMFEI